MKKVIVVLTITLFCIAVFLCVNLRSLRAERGKVKNEETGLSERVKTAGIRPSESAEPASPPKIEKPLLSTPFPATQKPQTDQESQGIFALKPPSDPAEARLVLRQINGEALRNKYAAMFDKLGLTPEQRQQFIDLCLDWMEHKTALYRSVIAADPTLRDKSLLHLVAESVTDATIVDYEAGVNQDLR